VTRYSEETTWEEGWNGHQEAQLRRLARLPLADKLTWLEEAHDLVRHLSCATPDLRSEPADAGQDVRKREI